MPQTTNPYVYLRPDQAIDALGDVDSAHDLLAMVADTLAGDVPRIGDMLADDPTQAHAVLHTLKGFLPVVCDESVAALVTQVEQSVRHGDHESARRTWPQAQQSLQQLGVDIQRWLAARAKLPAVAAAPAFVAPVGVVELGSADADSSAEVAQAEGPKHLRLDQARAALGDEATVHDMLELLVQTLDADLPRVLDALDHHDVGAAQGILHPIKGFLPVFCSGELCDMVATVEYLSKDSTAAEVRAAFEAVRPQLRELRDEAAAHLCGSASADAAGVIAAAHAGDQHAPPHGLDATELTELPSDFGLSAFGHRPSPVSELPLPSYQYLKVSQAQAMLGSRQAVLDTSAILRSALRSDVPAIRQALVDGDVAQAGRLLHALKGSLAVFCDEATADTVATVQFLSTQCTAPEVLTAFESAEPSLNALADEIDDFMARSA